MNENRTIYVGNIPPKVNAITIGTKFEQFGQIVRCDIPSPSDFKKTYAFIEFVHASDAINAIHDMHGKLFLNSKLNIGWARETPNPNAPLPISKNVTNQNAFKLQHVDYNESNVYPSRPASAIQNGNFSCNDHLYSSNFTDHNPIRNHAYYLDPDIPPDRFSENEMYYTRDEFYEPNFQPERIPSYSSDAAPRQYPLEYPVESTESYDYPYSRRHHVISGSESYISPDNEPKVIRYNGNYSHDAPASWININERTTYTKKSIGPDSQLVDLYKQEGVLGDPRDYAVRNHMSVFPYSGSDNPSNVVPMSHKSMSIKATPGAYDLPHQNIREFEPSTDYYENYNNTRHNAYRPSNMQMLTHVTGPSIPQAATYEQNDFKGHPNQRMHPFSDHRYGITRNNFNHGTKYADNECISPGRCTKNAKGRRASINIDHRVYQDQDENNYAIDYLPQSFRTAYVPRKRYSLDRGVEGREEFQTQSNQVRYLNQTFTKGHFPYNLKQPKLESYEPTPVYTQSTTYRTRYGELNKPLVINPTSQHRREIRNQSVPAHTTDISTSSCSNNNISDSEEKLPLSRFPHESESSYNPKPPIRSIVNSSKEMKKDSKVSVSKHSSCQASNPDSVKSFLHNLMVDNLKINLTTPSLVDTATPYLNNPKLPLSLSLSSPKESNLTQINRWPTTEIYTPSDCQLPEDKHTQGTCNHTGKDYFDLSLDSFVVPSSSNENLPFDKSNDHILSSLAIDTCLISPFGNPFTSTSPSLTSCKLQP